MTNNKNRKLFVNDNDDPTYENWLALYACIVNKSLSAGKALKIMELSKRDDVEEEKVWADI